MAVVLVSGEDGLAVIDGAEHLGAYSRVSDNSLF